MFRVFPRIGTDSVSAIARYLSSAMSVVPLSETSSLLTHRILQMPCEKTGDSTNSIYSSFLFVLENKIVYLDGVFWHCYQNSFLKMLYESEADIK